VAGPNDKATSPAQRVEVRVGGRVLFSQDCWDVTLDADSHVLKLQAALHPTLVEVAKNPPQRFDPDNDPRDGDEVIQRVHTGSQRVEAPRPQVAAPRPKKKVAR
jgi:hypothetical protein